MLKYDNKYDVYLSLQRTEIKNKSAPEIQMVIQNDYNIFSKHIPNTVKKWMDIGCGLGLINIFIHKKIPNGIMYLLDKTLLEKDKRLIGYDSVQTFGFYNSLEAAKELLISNNVKEENIHLVTPDNISIPDNDLDLVLSRFSWCFHYPYSVYADIVHSKLVSGGRLILDVRKGHLKEVTSDSRYKWTILHETKKATVVLGIRI